MKLGVGPPEQERKNIFSSLISIHLVSFYVIIKILSKFIVSSGKAQIITYEQVCVKISHEFNNFLTSFKAAAWNSSVSF